MGCFGCLVIIGTIIMPIIGTIIGLVIGAGLTGIGFVFLSINAHLASIRKELEFQRSSAAITPRPSAGSPASSTSS
jgi:hypothetical protein